MKRSRNVLLVAGLEDGPFPRRIFDLALRLARRNQAKLTLIDVVPDNELASELLPPELVELDLRERREALGRLAKVAQNEGVDIETELTVGKPFLEITRRVQSFKHDLVMTDGGRGEEARGWINGTTMHLMRKCPCAIWCSATPRRPLHAGPGRHRSVPDRSGKGLSQPEDHGARGLHGEARGERASRGPRLETVWSPGRGVAGDVEAVGAYCASRAQQATS